MGTGPEDCGARGRHRHTEHIQAPWQRCSRPVPRPWAPSCRWVARSPCPPHNCATPRPPLPAPITGCHAVAGAPARRGAAAGSAATGPADRDLCRCAAGCADRAPRPVATGCWHAAGRGAGTCSAGEDGLPTSRRCAQLSPAAAAHGATRRQALQLAGLLAAAPLFPAAALAAKGEWEGAASSELRTQQSRRGCLLRVHAR